MKKRNIIIVIIASLLAIIGVTYAWFSVTVQGNDTSEDIVTETGTLSLLYTDTLELSLDNAKPGDAVTKTFTVKNTGTLDTEYLINWNNLINTIRAGELRVTLNCVSKDSSGTISGTCESIEDKMVPYTEEAKSDYKIKDHIFIASGITHEYTLIVEFIEKDKNQNYNQGKTFSGKINISGTTPKPVNNCTFDGELVQGAEYVNGQYTYRYMQEYDYGDWKNIDDTGWGVILTDSGSTDSVTTALCTSINNKPIVSMAQMFAWSQVTSIDFSSFDTSNVTNMSEMFNSSSINVLNLSNFDTSNVTNMRFMFMESNPTTINVSGFDTSNVTNMEAMFWTSSPISIEGIEQFDTSNVTNMRSMFYYGSDPNLNINSFDTSNVNDMSFMFSWSQASELDLSSFDTSNVTNMSNMFENSEIDILDLRNWNTSNVTDMYYMFFGSGVNTIYVSDNWDVSNVKISTSMFGLCGGLVGESGTSYAETDIDEILYARIDKLPEFPGYFTYKAN